MTTFEELYDRLVKATLENHYSEELSSIQREKITIPIIWTVC